MRRLVKVHCCGATLWLVHVPSVDRWTVVDDKRAIATAAKAMVLDVTGERPTELDLTPGRALGSVEDWAGSETLQRWTPRVVPNGVA